MDNLEDLRKKMIALRDAIPNILADSAKEYSLNIKASAERNIREKGTGKYSTKKYNPATFLGSELNGSGTSYLKDLIAKSKQARKDAGYNEEDYFTSYAEFKEAQGLQGKFVDLSYSNEMWRGMLPSAVERIANVYISKLAHNNEEGQSKMNANFNRYGDFIFNNADVGQIKEATSKMFFIKVKRILK